MWNSYFLRDQIEGNIEAENANKILAELTRMLNEHNIDYRFYVDDEIDAIDIDADVEVSVFYVDDIPVYSHSYISNKEGD